MRNERLTKDDVFGRLKELDRYTPMDGCRERDPGMWERGMCFIILTALHLCENFTLDRVLQMQISKSIVIYRKN